MYLGHLSIHCCCDDLDHYVLTKSLYLLHFLDPCIETSYENFRRVYCDNDLRVFVCGGFWVVFGGKDKVSLAAAVNEVHFEKLL